MDAVEQVPPFAFNVTVYFLILSVTVLDAREFPRLFFTTQRYFLPFSASVIVTVMAVVFASEEVRLTHLDVLVS